MNDVEALKILFIVNPGSGSDDTDWKQLIETYFQNSSHQVSFFMLQRDTDCKEITDLVKQNEPDRLVTVGGDGTVKIGAQAVMHSQIPLGIIPAGSANGLSKELNIPADLTKALDVIVAGEQMQIHLTMVNDEICIHLSDIGFNAFVIKRFETGAHRGMWGYVKAAWKVLWQQPLMTLDLKIDDKPIRMQAAMIVIANATKYGTGAHINPDGKLDDDCFEIVVVRKVSFSEIFKMIVTHMPFDETKTKVFQVKSVEINSKRKAHFQVDGEYLGKVNTVKATLVPAALRVIVPVSDQQLAK